MTYCDELLERIEAIAAGDLAPDTQTTAHLRSCGGCSAALEAARQIDRLLQVRSVPEPPRDFTNRTLARVRRERWRREQVFDIGFNIAVGAVLLGAVGAAWLFLDLSGLSVIGRETVSLLEAQIIGGFRAIAPSVGGYAAAIGLLIMVLAIWWWAERGVQY